MASQLGFVFPGQGSQSVGMLSDLALTHAAVVHTFEEASEALGLDLWRLVREGPKPDLNRTENTQPAMLAAGVAVWRVLREQGAPEPGVMAGHSLGEYTALVCAEALGFADAIALVAERGRLMQASVAPGVGAMAAILGLDDDQVRAVCARAAQGEVVEAVNFNAPGQVVVAGRASAVQRAVAMAKDAGARRAVTLPVSVPSHCALMRPAAQRLAETLAGVDLRLPTVPVLHNVTVAAAQDPAEIRDLLARQLYSPVRWVETIQRMAQRGTSVLIEAGPGKVLAGLSKRIDNQLLSLAVYDAAGVEQVMEALSDVER